MIHYPRKSNMELLDVTEIQSIVNQYGFTKVLNWSVKNYANELIGYLGDHLKLTVEVEFDGEIKILQFFAKCMPRYDKWKSEYLKEAKFFLKEYVMLSDLFKQFLGSNNWHPKLLFAREEIFVFEDVKAIGYVMPCHRNTLSYDELMATVDTLAKFHAQSIIFEEKKTKELNRPYRLWEEYSDYLTEPPKGQCWRDAGRNAVIDFLNVYSAHKSRPYFAKRLEIIIPMLYNGVLTLMTPSTEYRNVVIHRDLWSNNILLSKQANGQLHALIVDFQTVLYCSPMLDLSSLLFFNTTRSFRDKHTTEVIEFYYEALSRELNSVNVDVGTIFDKTKLMQAYEDSILFGITQAAIIVPIIAMNSEKREEIFSNPETCFKANEISRSEEFIDIAREDDMYRWRVTELFDEIVDRYVFTEGSSANGSHNNGYKFKYMHRQQSI